jgi:hypothetical protein
MRARIPLLAALTALSLTVPAIAHARSRDHRAWSAGWAIAGRPDIHLRTDDARVRLHATSGDSVRVRVESHSQANGILFGRRDPRVSFDRNGRRVDIEVLEGSVSGILVVSSENLTVDVWAPAGSDLQVRSDDGRVELAGFSGRVDVHTDDGAIELEEVSGVVSLSSGDGRITVDGMEGSLMVDTNDGGAVVRGRFTGLGVESGDGRLDVTVEPGSDLSEGGSITSGDGRVMVRLPRDMPLTFDARSHDGALRVDLPVSVHESRRGRHFSGELNGGGPRLTVRSRDGSVTMEAL